MGEARWPRQGFRPDGRIHLAHWRSLVAGCRVGFEQTDFKNLENPAPQISAVCPEFVVEVMSPSDRLKAAKSKMEEWIRGGAQLGWLIDGDKRTVYIYRAGREAEKRVGITKLGGEGSVAGFELDLTDIWAGL